MICEAGFSQQRAGMRHSGGSAGRCPVGLCWRTVGTCSVPSHSSRPGRHTAVLRQGTQRCVLMGLHHFGVKRGTSAEKFPVRQLRAKAALPVVQLFYSVARCWENSSSAAPMFSSVCCVGYSTGEGSEPFCQAHLGWLKQPKGSHATLGTSQQSHFPSAVRTAATKVLLKSQCTVLLWP